MEMFAAGFLLSLSLCLDLGIVNVAAMRAGVQDGVRASFALGLGSCCGDLVYAGLALAGVTALLELAAIRWALWIGGTTVLLWLAVNALRDALHPTLPGDDDARRRATPRTTHDYFRYGLMLALSSPSALLWFATIGGAVIATTAAGSRAAAGAFFAGFFASGLAWSVFVAVVSSHGRRFGARFIRGFAVASAVLFAGLAVKVFVDGYAALGR
jgi:L-lysine exporter family protein LysE/ArgO